MAKGASIKFVSYEETVPKLLDALKLQNEIKKYDKIVLKPTLANPSEDSTPAAFTEEVLKFCLEHKNPVAEVFIAEGAEEDDTIELFEALEYQKIAEKYGIGLIDLNNTETEELDKEEFIRFTSIHYPSILSESFVISLPKLVVNDETDISGSLSTMLGAFPANHYSGFFSQGKNKIRKWPIKYSVHDIITCKVPDFAVVDSSEFGSILAGLPLEIDKQSSKILGKEWKEVPHLRLIDQSFSNEELD